MGKNPRNCQKARALSSGWKHDPARVRPMNRAGKFSRRVKRLFARIKAIDFGMKLVNQSGIFTRGEIFPDIVPR